MSVYTVPEASERLSVSPSTVRRWIRQGRLAAVKLAPGRAGTVRVTESAIDQFLTSSPAPTVQGGQP